MPNTKRTESTLQMSIHDLLSRAGIFHFAPLNETAMMILKMFKVPDKTCCTIINYLKKMGLTSGIPDILILHKGTVYFLELKSETGKLSDVQKCVHSALLSKGYQVATAYNFDEAYWKLKEWGMM